MGQGWHCNGDGIAIQQTNGCFLLAPPWPAADTGKRIGLLLWPLRARQAETTARLDWAISTSALQDGEVSGDVPQLLAGHGPANKPQSRFGLSPGDWLTLTVGLAHSSLHSSLTA